MKQRLISTCALYIFFMILVFIVNPRSTIGAYIDICIDPGHGGSDPGTLTYIEYF
jgi:hypothetical protein